MVNEVGLEPNSDGSREKRVADCPTARGNAGAALSLDLDVTHTYVSDLRVTLTGPDGTKATGKIASSAGPMRSNSERPLR